MNTDLSAWPFCLPAAARVTSTIAPITFTGLIISFYVRSMNNS